MWGQPQPLWRLSTLGQQRPSLPVERRGAQGQWLPPAVAVDLLCDFKPSSHPLWIEQAIPVLTHDSLWLRRYQWRQTFFSAPSLGLSYSSCVSRGCAGDSSAHRRPRVSSWDVDCVLDAQNLKCRGFVIPITNSRPPVGTEPVGELSTWNWSQSGCWEGSG